MTERPPSAIWDPEFECMRVEALRESLTRSRERVDAYTLQLQQHGLDGAEREVRWLNELIAHERDNDSPTSSTHIREQ